GGEEVGGVARGQAGGQFPGVVQAPGDLVHDLCPAGLELADDGHGVGLGAGEGGEVADQRRGGGPGAAPEPGDLGQGGGRAGVADRGEQQVEPGPGQQVGGYRVEKAG